MTQSKNITTIQQANIPDMVWNLFSMFIQWEDMNAAPKFKANQTGINFDGLYALSSDNRVWFAPTDNQQQWQQLSTPSSSLGVKFIRPVVQGFLFLDLNGKINYCNDSLIISYNTSTPVKYVSAGPLGFSFIAKKGIIFGINEQGMIVKLDLGNLAKDWSSQNLALPNGTNSSIAIEQDVTGAFYLIGGNGKLYYSLNGKNWTQIAQQFTAPKGYSYQVTQIAITLSGLVYAVIRFTDKKGNKFEKLYGLQPDMMNFFNIGSVQGGYEQYAGLSTLDFAYMSIIVKNNGEIYTSDIFGINDWLLPRLNAFLNFQY